MEASDASEEEYPKGCQSEGSCQQASVRLAALTGEQFDRLLQHRLIRTEPYRTMVLVAACTGLTASELSALRWRDVDRKNGKLYVRNPTAWEISTNITVPLSPGLADSLLKWKRRSHFKHADNLVFARRGGKLPFDFSRVQKDRLEQAGIDIGFGRLGFISPQLWGMAQRDGRVVCCHDAIAAPFDTAPPDRRHGLRVACASSEFQSCRPSTETRPLGRRSECSIARARESNRSSAARKYGTESRQQRRVTERLG